MRALVVANPAATTTTRKVRDVLVRALASELDVDFVETGHRGHARELAATAAAEGIDVLVTLGGDGTVNEAVNGLLDGGGTAAERPALAVVPGGSTNVFSRALGRSRNPVEATAEILESLRAGRVHPVSLGTASACTDGGWTEPRAFVFAAGLGFDADVIARVERQRSKGRRSTGLLYVRAGTQRFMVGRDRRRPPLTARVPGQPPVDGLFLALVSNVSPWTYLGAHPINPSPEASFETGLDVFATGRMGAVRMLTTVRRTMADRPVLRGRAVHRWHDLGEITLTASRPQKWQLDGDHLGEATALRTRSLPAALRVVG